MAIVYLAQDLKHARQVAIKILRPEIATVIGEDRFLREIEVAARMTHPHILPLHDSGVALGLLYYVMPYISGETLRARLARERQLPLDDALHLARQIASALGYAHEQGVVHRDIKPENVLLADGLAVVADFGIARVLGGAGDTSLTSSGFIVGTPKYMAPEQLKSGAIDGRADLYALGCVLFEMLAGEPPFDGTSIESLVHQHLSVAPRMVTDLRPSVPRIVAEVVMKTMAKLPADRFPTAARLAEALSVAAANRTVYDDTLAGPTLSVPNSLPIQRTAFIGRANELAECPLLLRESRLLTLTGVGGCGKTRLALQLARILEADFPEGVWFVDLGAFEDPLRVAEALAAAIGVIQEPERPLIETLARYLAQRRALIVLDNCEHLVAACAEVTDRLLASGRHLRVIATSREPLGVDGEQALALSGLSVPGSATRGPGAVLASESVQLFLNRARAIAPELELTANEIQTVGAICDQLEGIPLAIELAAARVRVLSTEEIRSRLDDRFHLLTGGHRTTPPRHRTLRATIQWSFDLLAPYEQRILRALSVFSGGWTLEAARVVADGAADEFEFLDVLEGLVRKSLVTVVREAASSTRYSMLETIRQYLWESLEAAHESEPVQARHAAFFLGVVKDTREPLVGPEQPSCLARLSDEHDNILRALSWWTRSPDGAERGLEFASLLGRFWYLGSHFALGQRLLAAALSRVGAQNPTRTRSIALNEAGGLAVFQGDYATARPLYEEALILAREHDDPQLVAWSLTGLGHIAGWQGDFRTSRTQYLESLGIVGGIGETNRIAGALHNLGATDLYRGDLPSARHFLDGALVKARECGSTHAIAINLAYLGIVATRSGDDNAARACIVEAAGLTRTAGLKRPGAYVLEGAAEFAMKHGEARSATVLLGASEALRSAVGVPLMPVESDWHRSTLVELRGSLESPGFETAMSQGRGLSFEAALDLALEMLDRRHG